MAAAYAVGDLYASVPDDDWGRKGIRSDGSVFNLASLGPLPPPRHRAPPARRGDAGRAGHRRLPTTRTPSDYAAGTSAMPDEVTAHLDRFVDLVGTEARVLEIGIGPGRDAVALEQIGLSVRRTDISPGFVERLPRRRASSPTSSTRSATTSPTRCAAGRRTTASGPTPRCCTSVATPADRARAGSRPSPGPAAPLHLTLKEGDGARWSVHGHVGAPRFFTFWREDAAARRTSPQAGWVVDERAARREHARRPAERVVARGLRDPGLERGVRHTELWARMEAALGAGYARHWASQTVLASSAGGRPRRRSTRA